MKWFLKFQFAVIIFFISSLSMDTIDSADWSGYSDNLRLKNQEKYFARNADNDQLHERQKLLQRSRDLVQKAEIARLLELEGRQKEQNWKRDKETNAAGLKIPDRRIHVQQYALKTAIQENGEKKQVNYGGFQASARESPRVRGMYLQSVNSPLTSHHQWRSLNPEFPGQKQREILKRPAENYNHKPRREIPAEEQEGVEPADRFDSESNLAQQAESEQFRQQEEQRLEQERQWEKERYDAEQLDMQNKYLAQQTENERLRQQELQRLEHERRERARYEAEMRYRKEEEMRRNEADRLRKLAEMKASEEEQLRQSDEMRFRQESSRRTGDTRFSSERLGKNKIPESPVNSRLNQRRYESGNRGTLNQQSEPQRQLSIWDKYLPFRNSATAQDCRTSMSFILLLILYWYTLCRS